MGRHVFVVGAADTPKVRERARKPDMRAFILSCAGIEFVRSCS